MRMCMHGEVGDPGCEGVETEEADCHDRVITLYLLFKST